MFSDISTAKLYWNILPILNNILDKALPFDVSNLFLEDVDELIKIKGKLLKFSRYEDTKKLFKIKAGLVCGHEVDSFSEKADSLFTSGAFRVALCFYVLGFFFDNDSLDPHQWPLKGMARCIFHGYSKSSPFIENLAYYEKDLF